MSLKRGIFVFVLVLLLLFSFFVSSVSALNACCERDRDGNWCQYADESNCDSSYLSTYTSCEQTSFCQVGCCYSSDTGSCYENTPQATCDAEEGTSWSDSSACEIDQCQKGCCVIADQAFYVTEVACKSVGSEYEDASVSFDDSITTESACLDSVKNLDYGCCVDGDTASFVTREDCSVASSEVTVNFSVEGFHEDMLCSNDLLSTDCAKQQYTACYQGKVYWYDSCGNRENIYSSDVDASYNQGYVLTEEDSCVPSGPNDPACGNCDYARGMICGADTEHVMQDGDYSCVDLNCADTYANDASPLSGGDKRNGESWCVYDDRVGEGLDTVGSRHYRHLCINGEELTEPCADYREEICISGVLSEDVLGTLDAFHLGSGDYVEAACRENRDKDCSTCNDATLGLTDKYECCVDEDTRDCYWLPGGATDEVVDDVAVTNGTCVPQVPPGLKFWSDSGSGDDVSSSDTCSVASTTCTATYRIGGVARALGGSDNPEDWKLISESPDGCTTRDWLLDQNTHCRSVGDCGAYYNYVGEAGLDGFSSSMFDEAFFFTVDPIEESDLEDFDYLTGVDEINEGNIYGIRTTNWLKNPVTWITIGSVLYAGALGVYGEKSACDAATVAAVGATQKTADAGVVSTYFDRTSLPSFGEIYSKTVAETSHGLTAPAVPELNAAVKAANTASTAVGLHKAKETLSDFGCLFGSVAPLPGKLVGIGGPKTVSVGIANWITLIGAAYLVVDYANDNETTVTYNVDCNLWQPPTGGDNCELCNDPNTPCSEYRCHSLGASCALVNEGTGNETCISQYVNDVNSPVIEPLESVIEDSGYTITPTEEEGNKGYEINELIPAFTPVTLGINTDEPAQCKYTPEVGVAFEDMNNFFGDTIYEYNHSLTFSLSDEVTNEEIVALTQGVYTINVRCADANGNANERDYFIRFTVDTTPDLTPPEVAYTSIQDGSYMPYGGNETRFSLYTDEPASCRWGNEDTDYAFMTGEMNCASSGFEQSSVYYGTYECSTTLTGVADEETNSFYFRCEDQSGNINEDSYVFTTKQTPEPLELVSVAPSGTVYDFSLLLEAATEGGAEDGTAVCGFSDTDVDYYSMVVFAESNSTSHSQNLDLIEGDYTYYITCQDIAGNRASNSTSFSVQIDTEAPVLSSLSVDSLSSLLFLGMDEASTCEYAPESFSYGDGTLMTGFNTTAHEANLDAAQYYVLCEDSYANQGSYFIDLSTWV